MKLLLLLLAMLGHPVVLSAEQPPADAAARASILVFGGSGRLGAEIVRELLARGHGVTVFVRPSSDRRRLDGLSVQFVEGDVLREDDVRRAFGTRRFDVVVDALGRSESPPSFYATSGRSIARWAKQTGVRQVILHGSVGVGSSRAALPGLSSGTMADVMQAKEAAEQALVASGVPYTIIRNAILRDDLRSTRPRLVEDARAVGPVSRRSLAQLTGECVLQARCLDRVFTALDGPD